MTATTTPIHQPTGKCWESHFDANNVNDELWSLLETFSEGREHETPMRFSPEIARDLALVSALAVPDCQTPRSFPSSLQLRRYLPSPSRSELKLQAVVVKCRQNKGLRMLAFSYASRASSSSLRGEYNAFCDLFGAHVDSSLCGVREWAGIEGRVHREWLSEVERLWHAGLGQHMKKLQKKHRDIPKRIYLTGHGVGAAFAILTAAKLFFRFPSIQLAIYAFAPPKLSDATFVREIDNLSKRFRYGLFRITNCNDPVGLFPALDDYCSAPGMPYQISTSPCKIVDVGGIGHGFDAPASQQDAPPIITDKGMLWRLQAASVVPTWISRLSVEQQYFVLADHFLAPSTVYGSNRGYVLSLVEVVCPLPPQRSQVNDDASPSQKKQCVRQDIDDSASSSSSSFGPARRTFQI